MPRKNKSSDARDERISIPLDPEEALRALLDVDPDDEPVDDPKDDQQDEDHG